jgi:NAD(P)H-flavin reductase
MAITPRMSTERPAPLPAGSADPGETGLAMPPEAWRVARVTAETADTFTLALEACRAGGTLTFLPGQFNMVWAFGAGEVPISMSGPPGRVRQVVHTIRAVGHLTRTLRKLRRGDTVGLRGPFGTAWPVASAEGHDLVIVAGGIGLAPLRPVIYHALAHRARYGRVALFYGARAPGDLLFARELESWRGRFDFEVEITVDRAGPDWRGNAGVVTTLLRRVPFDADETSAFVCGPEIMMRFAGNELLQLGVPPERLWVSMERNMQCGIGLCGHCQLGEWFVCRDGPVFSWDRASPTFAVREL